MHFRFENRSSPQTHGRFRAASPFLLGRSVARHWGVLTSTHGMLPPTPGLPSATSETIPVSVSRMGPRSRSPTRVSLNEPDARPFVRRLVEQSESGTRRLPVSAPRPGNCRPATTPRTADAARTWQVTAAVQSGLRCYFCPWRAAYLGKEKQRTRMPRCLRSVFSTARKLFAVLERSIRASTCPLTAAQTGGASHGPYSNAFA